MRRNREAHARPANANLSIGKLGALCVLCGEILVYDGRRNCNRVFKKVAPPADAGKVVTLERRNSHRVWSSRALLNDPHALKLPLYERGRLPGLPESSREP